MPSNAHTHAIIIIFPKSRIINKLKRIFNESEYLSEYAKVTKL